jgi:hypothetical protein
MLDYDRDSVLPEEDFLVVACGGEFAVLVDEGDCVDWAQVLCVGLDDFVRAQVVLVDGFADVADQEGVLFVGVWVENCAEWVRFGFEGLDDFAGLGVPVVDAVVVAAGDEVVAVAFEGARWVRGVWNFMGFIRGFFGFFGFLIFLRGKWVRGILGMGGIAYMSLTAPLWPL